MRLLHASRSEGQTRVSWAFEGSSVCLRAWKTLHGLGLLIDFWMYRWTSQFTFHSPFQWGGPCSDKTKVRACFCLKKSLNIEQLGQSFHCYNGKPFTQEMGAFSACGELQFEEPTALQLIYVFWPNQSRGFQVIAVVQGWHHFYKPSMIASLKRYLMWKMMELKQLCI